MFETEMEIEKTIIGICNRNQNRNRHTTFKKKNVKLIIYNY